jgi:glycosyltransferase involved in cell wall biosynthesis
LAKPRVLTVVRPVQGGIQKHVSQLMARLQDDFAFTVACPPEMTAVFQGEGRETVLLPVRGNVHPPGDLQAVWQLSKMLGAGGFNLVHAHGYKAALLSRPASRIKNIPCLVTIHGELAHGANGRLAPLYRGLERYFSRWTDGYITVSQWLANQLTITYGVHPERITVIPNGICTKAKDVPQGGDLPFTEDEIVVGTVARLAPQKGIADFLQAADQVSRKLPQVKFAVVGDGPLRAGLEEMCRELGLAGRVAFTGFRPDVPALLRRFSLFVQPSLSEGQGLTVLEAMAAGCPVVASNTGGLPELVVHGRTGLLTEPGNAESISAAVLRLLGDSRLCQELAAEARNVVLRYDLQVMVRQTGDLYRRILEGR